VSVSCHVGGHSNLIPCVVFFGQKMNTKYSSEFIASRFVFVKESSNHTVMLHVKISRDVVFILNVFACAVESDSVIVMSTLHAAVIFKSSQLLVIFPLLFIHAKDFTCWLKCIICV
jgi:hypothetical protein